jgi:hypothetical protein
MCDLYSLTSESRCDADPLALAKYIAALLKRDKAEAELREKCLAELEVFLGDSKFAKPLRFSTKQRIHSHVSLRMKLSRSFFLVQSVASVVQ